MAFPHSILSLQSYRHSVTYSKKSVTYRWYFEDDHEQITSLEYEYGYHDKNSHFETFYVRQNQILISNVAIQNIPYIVDKYKHRLVKTEEIWSQHNKLVDKLSSVLGEVTSVSCFDYGWITFSPKIHLKIKVNKLKSPHQNTIQIQKKAPNEIEWKSALVDSKQLLSFVQKNKKNILEVNHKVEELAQQVQEMSIETQSQQEPSVQFVKPEKVDYSQFQKSRMFTHLPKAKRIAIQSCKPVKDEFEYLQKYMETEANVIEAQQALKDMSII